MKKAGIASAVLSVLMSILTGCGGDVEPMASPTAEQAATATAMATSPLPVGQTAAPTATRIAEVASRDCEELERPALVMVPSLGQTATPRAFVLVDADGEERCALGPPYVPWSSAECQVVGKRVMCWDEERRALQVLDVLRGETDGIQPNVREAEGQADFLVSPDGEQIVWSVTDLEVSRGDVPEGISRCRVTVSRLDGGGARTVVEETYDNLYHLMPVTWTPDGRGVFFARMRVWVESGGAFIPTFSGRYSELFRLDLASGEFQKAFPSDVETVCNRCIGDISPDGHWLAYHREDDALVLRDMMTGEEALVADASSACYVGRARLRPDGRHLVYVETEGPCDGQDTFDVARTVMVDVPFSGETAVLAESTEAVDWPVGWLDTDTPIFDRVYKGSDHRGYWVAGHSSAAEDLLTGVLIGVVRPAEGEREGSLQMEDGDPIAAAASAEAE